MTLNNDEKEALDGLLRAAQSGNHCFNDPEIARGYMHLLRQAQGLLLSRAVMRDGYDGQTLMNVFGGIMGEYK